MIFKSIWLEDNILILIKINNINEIQSELKGNKKILFTMNENIFYINYFDEIKNIKIEDLNINFILYLEHINEYYLNDKIIDQAILEMKKRALNVMYIGSSQLNSGYYDLDCPQKIMGDFINWNVLIRKDYLDDLNIINISEIKYKALILGLLNENYIYFYNYGQEEAAKLKNDYNYLNNFLKLAVSIMEKNPGYIKTFNKYIFNDLFQELSRICIKERDNNILEEFISSIKKYNEILNNVGEGPNKKIEELYNSILNNDIEEISLKLWYLLYKKSIYTSRIYDIENVNGNIICNCVIHSELYSEDDNNKLEKIDFYLYDEKRDHRIDLNVIYGEDTFYKDDYPEKMYINRKDNFKIMIPLGNLEVGRYKLAYKFLGEYGKFIISNFALARKLPNRSLKLKNYILNVKYEIISREVYIKVDRFTNGILAKIDMFKEEFINLQKINKDRKILYKYYLLYNLYKIKKKKIILIGEMPNTYQDSGRIVFESLRQNKSLEVYFVTNNNRLLDNKHMNYVRFGSDKHKKLFLIADALINVQNIDLYMSPFLNRKENLMFIRHSKDFIIYKAFSKYLYKQKKIFLQHGVLYQAGLTNAIYLNCDFDYFVISSPFERDIFPKGSRTAIESCLPRFSNYDNKESKNIILLSPTWRKYLKNIKEGEIDLEKIKQSEYYKRIISLLNNRKLKMLLEKYNYQLIYNIHHTLIDITKVELLESNCKNIKINLQQDNLNELISNSKICITDYSSLFFDFIWQKKKVLHYIYDYEDFHLRLDNNKKESRYFNIKGYYNSQNFTDECELIDKIESFMKNDDQIVYKDIFFDIEDPCSEFEKQLIKILG